MFLTQKKAKCYSCFHFEDQSSALLADKDIYDYDGSFNYSLSLSGSELLLSTGSTLSSTDIALFDVTAITAISKLFAQFITPTFYDIQQDYASNKVLQFMCLIQVQSLGGAMQPVIQWRLGAARRIQALIFSTMSQARGIQALFSKFFNNFDLYLTFKFFMGGRVAQWQGACPRTKKSAVQASTTASCCEGELFTYIQLLLFVLASCTAEISKQTTGCFRGEGLALDPIGDLQTLSKSFLWFLFRYLTLGRISRLQTLYINH